ncbi:MAG TPA: PEP-CTERM sorting domain-containing protein [Terriglobales bacterium]|nr:PEP-CTERM sorting domain-containing protein [Terriglobales bacterium]
MAIASRFLLVMFILACGVAHAGQISGAEHDLLAGGASITMVGSDGTLSPSLGITHMAANRDFGFDDLGYIGTIRDDEYSVYLYDSTATQPVPEPATIVLVSSGFALALRLRRRS